MIKTIILGDTHGDWSNLNRIINFKKPDVVIICGDFGYWTMNDIFDMRKIKKPEKTQIFWCAGNHENWESLEKIYGRHGKYPIEMNLSNRNPHSGIFYCPIGSTMNLNGFNILFTGGADSIDKNSRLIGYDWFPQEILTEKDLDYVFENVKEKVDIVISHTVPQSFNMTSTCRIDKMSDPSRKVLEFVLQHYKPKFWCAGHWHNFVMGRQETIGCNYFVLDYIFHGQRHSVKLTEKGIIL